MRRRAQQETDDSSLEISSAPPTLFEVRGSEEPDESSIFRRMDWNAGRPTTTLPPPSYSEPTDPGRLETSPPSLPRYELFESMRELCTAGDHEAAELLAIIIGIELDPEQ